MASIDEYYGLDINLNNERNFKLLSKYTINNASKIKYEHIPTKNIQDIYPKVDN